MKKVLAMVVIVVAAIVAFFVLQRWMGDDLDGLAGGTWVLVDIEIEGRRMPKDRFAGVSAQFAKDSVTWTTPKAEDTKGPARVDSSKSPRAIDLVLPGEDELVPGIYELKDDALRICVGDTRPREFSSQRKGQMLWTFKRK